jgi:hypothetical protein
MPIFEFFCGERGEKFETSLLSGEHNALNVLNAAIKT